MCAGDGRGEHDQQGAGLAAALQVQDEAQGPQGRQALKGAGQLTNEQTLLLAAVLPDHGCYCEEDWHSYKEVNLLL